MEGKHKSLYLNSEISLNSINLSESSIIFIFSSVSYRKYVFFKSQGNPGQPLNLRIL